VNDVTLVKGYSVDSRTLRPGDLYVALKGERVDGHAFLEAVKHQGAIGAIVSRDYSGSIEGLPLLRVPDPLHALQEIARQVLSRRKARVVAVTGSIGKTTTKDFIATLLKTRYHVSASPGNSNSQVGLPLAILNHTTGEEDILVLEMGMTLPGQLTRLVQIAPPEVAVLTSVALVHACNFHSLEEIAWAKAEIFSHPKTRLGVLHADIPQYELIRAFGSCRKLSFSLSSPADYTFDEQRHLIQAHVEGAEIPFASLKVPGKHNIHNALAAAIVARHFHMGWEAINEALQHLQLPERRLQFVEKNHIVFVNDSYNASELSVKAALTSLPHPNEGGRRIAVLGSMMELGKFSQECHQRVGEFALQHVDELYCLGQECAPMVDVWRMTEKPIELFLDRETLVRKLRSVLKPFDVVLLKGSRSKELWKILDEL
jgi:UDP-N-acetylmuramoyl-tripeptide--D-alanyl-D-alanine ligase